MCVQQGEKQRALERFTRALGHCGFQLLGAFSTSLLSAYNSWQKNPRCIFFGTFGGRLCHTYVGDYGGRRQIWSNPYQ